MFAFLFRLLWRILVGIIALALAFLTRYLVFPYLDDRMPVLLVIIILYLLAAYIFIPFLVRIWQLVIKPNHLPIYATTRDGWSSDPVNIAIICESYEQLVRAMTKAGWQKADKTTIWTSIKFMYALLLNKPYPNAPFSSLFLIGRRQDVGFQIPSGASLSPRHRHHIRFWQLDSTPDSENIHHNFWQTLLELFVRNKKRQIWIGAATHDVKPFAFRAQNLQVTHGIDPETNRERDFVTKTLQDQNLTRRIETITTGEQLRFRGQAFGIRIVVDGKLKVIELKKV